MRFGVVLALALGCGHHAPGDQTPHDSSAPIDSTGSGSGSGSGDPSTSIAGQAVSCYSQGAPSTTCTLPSHCCFSNFTSQHDGSCSTSACAWGTIDCDGPEDCSNGGHCCSTQLVDPQSGIYGYRVACQSTACGTPPTHEELCHPTGPACTSGSCVTASGNNNDLPRSLYICR